MFSRKFDKNPSVPGDTKCKVADSVGVGLKSRNRGVLMCLGERSQWEAQLAKSLKEPLDDGYKDIHIFLE